MLKRALTRGHSQRASVRKRAAASRPSCAKIAFASALATGSARSARYQPEHEDTAIVTILLALGYQDDVADDPAE
jgi:hypothetical protein